MAGPISRTKSPAGGAPPDTTVPRGPSSTRTKTAPPGPKARRQQPRRRTPDELRAYAGEIYARLSALYPDAHCELDFRSAWELVIATILSAQCTDKRVNMVTPRLFGRFPTPKALAEARPEEVEEIIKSTGFFRAKTKSIIGMANAVVERFGGEVPPRMEDLVTLPGVGRKTANVVLGNAFGINVGVVVDTHVARLSQRLGLTSETEPMKIEQALMPLLPSDRWTMLSHLLIWHGRRVCEARKPRCVACTLADICPSALV
jgi:endonuclease-3